MVLQVLGYEVCRTQGIIMKCYLAAQLEGRQPCGLKSARTTVRYIKCTLVGPGNDSNAQTRLALLSEVKTRN